MSATAPSNLPRRTEPLLDVPRVRRPAASVLHALCFALALGATLASVRAALGALPAWALEEEGVARIKARHLAEHGADYDVLFVGSSQVYRQVDVALFERELARLERPLASYNLGLPGMRFFEMLARVERLLDARPARLRYLVVELQDADPDLREENERTRRDLGWHTPAVTWIACRTVLASPRPWTEKLALLRRHLLEGAIHVANQGQGLTALAVLLGQVEVPEDTTPGGFLPLERDAGPGTVERRRAFLEELTRDRGWLETRWQGLHDASRAPAALAPGLGAVLERLVQRCRAAGVEPVFLLLPPSDRRRTEMLAAREAGVLPNLIDLEDPDREPDFQRQLALRYDENHLNLAGAERLTTLLAQAFLDVVGGAE